MNTIFSNSSNTCYIFLCESLPNNIKDHEDRENLVKTIALHFLSVPGSKTSIRCHKNGKPYFPDFPSLHFNVSWTRQLTAVIFSEEETGIDMEKITVLPDPLPAAMFTPDENAQLSALNTEKEKASFFFRLWTKKEAFSKMLGCGLTLKTRSYSVLKPPISNILHTFTYEDTVISFCILKKPALIQLYKIQLKNTEIIFNCLY